VVLFVPSFETLMAQVWSARVQRGAPVRWGTFLGSWASRADLPPSADVAGLAEQWASRVGTERVHLVVTTSTALARHTTARILGLRTHDPVLGRPAPLTGAGVDVMRRVNRLLNVRQPPALRDPLLRRLTALLPTDLTQSQPELTVPRARRDWASDRAERLTERLRDRGYAVHGDLDQIAVRAARAETRPPRHEVLDAVLVACLRAARPDR
jgi:hypothetical protein